MEDSGNIAFRRGERLIFFAPHPDDETLAAGGMIQRAISAGIEVAVILVTNGDNNKWMQRLWEGRWRIDKAARARYGRSRKKEAILALNHLGVADSRSIFLGYPDQGLTRLLLTRDSYAIKALADCIAMWQPHILIWPSASDRHPDHSALAVLILLALDKLGAGRCPETILSYVIHGRLPDKDVSRLIRFRLSRYEFQLKKEAFLMHASQLAFRWPWYLDYLKEDEVFFKNDNPLCAYGHHPVRDISMDNGAIRLDFVLKARFGVVGGRTIYFVVVDSSSNIKTFFLEFRGHEQNAALKSFPDNEEVGNAVVLRGRRNHFTLVIEGVLFGCNDVKRLFVKLERKYGFFDEAGWLEARIKLD
ncbi:MAG: PIG-L family deacetylase [Desulfobacteraceae bacterium]|nr:PIG-L family deacetylase [Desulfobacteraceae bacterium]